MRSEASARRARGIVSGAVVVGLLLLGGCRGAAPAGEPADANREPKAGAEGPPPEGMVLVRGGYFTIGSDRGDADEAPAHKVGIDAFYIDAHEVTNAEFARFVETSGYQVDGPWRLYAGGAREAHPVVSVTWNDAAAYAAWAGKRLPTEAEWEVAARGGLDGKEYPGGDAIAPEDATFGHLYEEGPETTAVGSHRPNGYGLFDMGGNAWEWCADWYGADYYARSAALDPKGPERGVARVARGGSWNDRNVSLRVSNRLEMTSRIIGSVFGFRCAKTPEP